MNLVTRNQLPRIVGNRETISTLSFSPAARARRIFHAGLRRNILARMTEIVSHSSQQ